jgi:hypothetical protein
MVFGGNKFTQTLVDFFATLATVATVATALVSQASQAACDQTLSVGANVASAVSSAASGSTICLNAGSYGTINISGVTKSTPVTIQSASGQAASAYFVISQTSGLVFRSLTVNGMYMSNQAKNITVSGSKFTDQLLINMTANAGSSYGNANILIDGNTFDGISVCANCYEGRIEVLSSLPAGVIISNNHIGNAGESDGIQLGANGVQVGPGNVFDGIKQLNYSRHVDSIQLYGATNTKIIGNYFINNNVMIMAPDGAGGEIIKDNLFIGNGEYWPAIQFGSLEGGEFAHNTVKNVAVMINKKTENTTKSSNVSAHDNIMLNSSFTTTDGNGVASCLNCTFTRNLFDSNATGTNNLIGTPSFIGGSAPTTSAGWQLTSSSLGYRAGTDGLDLGATTYGSGAIVVPTPTATPIANATPAPTATPVATATPAPTAAPMVSGETLLGSSSPSTLDANDGVAYELGMKFSAKANGKITAIRFYKSPSESGSHTGKIYSSSGALLASVSFSSESSSGWQIAYLATPLVIAANTTYTVSVNTGAGFYVASENDFATQKQSTYLIAPAAAGVYGAMGAMPTTSWNNSSYFRDVVFVASSTTIPTATPAATPTSGDTTAPKVSITSPVDGSSVSRYSTVTITASASDNVTVQKVEFYVNGTLKCTDTTAPFACAWAIGRGRGVPYALQAIATDAAGNKASSAVVNVKSR